MILEFGSVALFNASQVILLARKRHPSMTHLQNLSYCRGKSNTGISERILKEEVPDERPIRTLFRQLSQSHNGVILSPCQDTGNLRALEVTSDYFTAPEEQGGEGCNRTGLSGATGNYKPVVLSKGNHLFSHVEMTSPGGGGWVFGQRTSKRAPVLGGLIRCLYRIQCSVRGCAACPPASSGSA